MKLRIKVVKKDCNRIKKESKGEHLKHHLNILWI